MERFLDMLIPDVAGFAAATLALVLAGVVVTVAVIVSDRRLGAHASGALLAHPTTSSLSLLGVTSSVAFATDVALSWLCSLGFAAFSVACVADRMAARLPSRGDTPSRLRSGVRSLCEVVSWLCVVDLAILFVLCVVETVVPRYLAMAGGAS